jgi:hypothetical protein
LNLAVNKPVIGLLDNATQRLGFACEGAVVNLRVRVEVRVG